MPVKINRLQIMWRSLLCVFILFNVKNVAGLSPLCDITSNANKNFSCSTQAIDDMSKNDTCNIQVYTNNSPNCSIMQFGPLMANTHIEGVTLKPYVITKVHDKNLNHYAVNHTVLNITFSNIKWKTMRFRFQDRYGNNRNHCRTLTISNDTVIDDSSVLYYDCYWTNPGDSSLGQSHILDFEAYVDGQVNRGQYHFNAPSAEMLSPVAKPEEWKPFIYIEIIPSVLRLHLPPPPARLKINSYRIEVRKECGKETEVMKTSVLLSNKTTEVTYDYNFFGDNGLFYFVVTPMHRACEIGVGCRNVESPKIKISTEGQTLSICIASVTALIVASLFAYYLALKALRRYCCKDQYKLTDMEIPPPTKVLVVYSSANRLHAECVTSLVTYLRSECGLDVAYDGDLAAAAHGDPYVWAEEAFALASHVLYVAGPAQETSSIYDKPITAHRNIDLLLLGFIKANRAAKCPKDIINIRFEHSTAPLPVETRMDRTYFLLKDWQKFISHLSKNLLPKRQIMRTERGKHFLDKLMTAKEKLNLQSEEIVRCGPEKNSEKKILL